MNEQKHWLGLQGRVCVVTGAASGIGAGIAQALADAGAKVALLDRNTEGSQAMAAKLNAQGATAISIACDTTHEAQVKAAAQRVADELGITPRRVEQIRVALVDLGWLKYPQGFDSAMASGRRRRSIVPPIACSGVLCEHLSAGHRGRAARGEPAGEWRMARRTRRVPDRARCGAGRATVTTLRNIARLGCTG